MITWFLHLKASAFLPTTTPVPLVYFISRMSSELFSRAPRRRNTRPHRTATLEIPREPHAEGSCDSPPLHSESRARWHHCGDPYRYPSEPSKDPLETLNSAVESRDQEICRELRDEINFLMVVAGLFLAIVTAFTLDSYKKLQEDNQSTSSDLLIEIVRLLNNTNNSGHATLPKRFTPDDHDVVVNQLWFSSMTLSIFTVIFGTLCLQWISTFSRGSDLNSRSIPPERSLVMRQLRFEGLVGWGVLHTPELLLFMLQVSIGLFTSGLVYFFWNVSHRAALPALVMACIAGALLLLSSLIPFYQYFSGMLWRKSLMVPQCPYKSPTSWLVQSICAIGPSILTLFINSTWLQALPLPFTDYTWKKHDLMCLSLRESSQDAGFHFRHFGLGLLSALKDFAYDTDTAFTISTFLKLLQSMFTKAQDWESFLQQKLSHDEKGFLNEEYRLVPDPQRHDNISLFKYARKIRVDFINAITLQFLARHNRNLVRAIFRHRVELYIRIMNSVTFIRTRGNNSPDFGNSLRCPLQDHNDIANLDRDLRYQFLRCAKRLIELRRATDHDILSAAAIVAIDGPPITHVPIPEDAPRPGDPPPPDMNDLDGQPDPGPGSPDILPDEGERDEPGPPSHEITTEDPQHKDPFARLCDEVLERLVELRQSDFTDMDSYIELRQFLRCDARAIVRKRENPLRRGGMYPLWMP